MLAASQLGFKGEILVEQVAHKGGEHVVEDVDHDMCQETMEDTGNREEAGLTNAHGRAEDANADQGDKGGDNLQMERVNQLSGEERDEHQGTSGRGKANPQVVYGSTEQELLGSEAQMGAQDGQLEDGSDIEREEERPDSRATSTPLAATQTPVVTGVGPGCLAKWWRQGGSSQTHEEEAGDDRQAERRRRCGRCW